MNGCHFAIGFGALKLNENFVAFETPFTGARIRLGVGGQKRCSQQQEPAQSAGSTRRESAGGVFRMGRNETALGREKREGVHHNTYSTNAADFAIITLQRLSEVRPGKTVFIRHNMLKVQFEVRFKTRTF
jgi:hypothetical protein